MTTPRRTRWLHLLGSALVILSLLFIANLLWRQRQTIFSSYQGRDFLWLAAAIVIYCLACFALARGWRSLLLAMTHSIPLNQVTRWIYARSQIAKYLPGNVLHIAGRHLLGKQFGVGHQALAYAALLELICLSGCALLVSVPGVLFAGTELPQINGAVIISVIVLLLAGLWLLPRLLNNVFKRIQLEPVTIDRNFIGQLIRATLFYLLFFLLAGWVIVALVIPLRDALSLSDMAYLLLAFAMSWLVGFITPGAPSGIGVREAALVLMLRGLLGVDGATLLAVLLRVATVGGDLLFWFFIEADRKLRWQDQLAD